MKEKKISKGVERLKRTLPSKESCDFAKSRTKLSSIKSTLPREFVFLFVSGKDS